VNKEEARQFLEERDICLKHFLKRQKIAGTRKVECPECFAAQERTEQGRIDAAIRVLADEIAPPPQSLEEWTPYQNGSLPPNNLRVYMVVVGFIETTGRTGGKEAVTVGKPLFWRRKHA
jgi:hypothetical protein